MRLRLLDIRENEWSTAGPSLALATLSVGALTLAAIASDALFVSAFDIGRLAGFYVITTAGRVAASLAYGVHDGRARVAGSSGAGAIARADMRLFVLAAALALVSGLTASVLPSPLLYLLCAALQTVPALLPLVTMNAAMERFDAQGVRRLLPLVACAATVGAIVASLLARLLAGALGTGSLLVVAAALCAGAAVLRLRLAGGATPRAGEEPPAHSRGIPSALVDGLRDLREVPLVRTFVTGAFFATATMCLVDFGFKSALKERYERDDIAGFLGSFTLGASVLVLLAQLFLTGRLLARTGIRSALQSRPAALVLLSPLMAISWVGAATTVKLVETVLRVGLTGPAAALLLLPAPAPMRARLKLFAGSVAVPLGALAAAFVIIPFGGLGPSRPFLAFMLAVAAAGSVASLARAHAAYTGALVEGLVQGRVSLDVSPEAADLVRTELSTILAGAVESGDPRRATQLLALMSDGLFTLEDIAPALAAGDAVSRAAMETAVRLARPGDGPALLAMVRPGEDDELERRVLALARALGAPAERERLDRAYVRCRDRADEAAAGLWAEALTALVRIQPDGAMTDLRRAAEGPDSPQRAAAVRALAELAK